MAGRVFRKRPDNTAPVTITTYNPLAVIPPVLDVDPAVHGHKYLVALSSLDARTVIPVGVCDTSEQAARIAAVFEINRRDAVVRGATVDSCVEIVRATYDQATGAVVASQDVVSLPPADVVVAADPSAFVRTHNALHPPRTR